MVIRRPQNYFGFNEHKRFYFTFTWMTLFFGHQTVHTKLRIKYKVDANSEINTKHINTVWTERRFVEC